MIAHSGFSQDKCYGLPGGASDSHPDSDAQGFAVVRAGIIGSRGALDGDPGHAGEGEDDTEDGRDAQFFTEEEPGDDGGHDRRNRVDEEGEAGADENVGAEEEGIANGEADDAG